LIAVVAGLSLVAAACGGDDDDSAEPAADEPAATTTPVEETTATTAAAEEPAATTAPAEEPAAEGLVIWADDTRTPVFQEIGEQFTADTGVPVEVVEVDFGTIKDQIIQQGPAGEAADIIIGAHDWLGELVQSGVVAPVDLPNASEYEPVGLNAFTWDGQLYGVPIAIENLGLFRNTELVPDQLTDWNEVLSTVQGELDEGTVDVGIAVQNAPDPDVYHNYPLETMYGSYIFGTNADGTYNPEDLGIATDAGKAYAAAWKDWTSTGVLDPTLDPDTAKAAFTEGRAAFYITGPWNLADVRDSGVPYAIDPFPSLDGVQGSPFVGVQGIMINAFSDNLLLAQAFATDYMATQDAQFRLFELGGRAPAHTAALADAAATDPDLGGFGAAGAAGQPLPAIPEMGAVWGNLTNGYKLILDGTDPGEAFQEAQDLIVAAIKG
jgi:maltose-binding protein MalE